MINLIPSLKKRKMRLFSEVFNLKMKAILIIRITSNDNIIYILFLTWTTTKIPHLRS